MQSVTGSSVSGLLTVSIVGFASVAFLLSPYRTEQKNLPASLTLFVHYLLVTYLLLGWLTQNCVALQIYIIAVMIVGISWLIFKNKCILTVLNNRLNNDPDDKPFVNAPSLFAYLTGFALIAVSILKLSQYQCPCILSFTHKG
jgi:hypothetical protein